MSGQNVLEEVEEDGAGTELYVNAYGKWDVRKKNHVSKSQRGSGSQNAKEDDRGFDDNDKTFGEEAILCNHEWCDEVIKRKELAASVAAQINQTQSRFVANLQQGVPMRDDLSIDVDDNHGQGAIAENRGFNGCLLREEQEEENARKRLKEERLWALATRVVSRFRKQIAERNEKKSRKMKRDRKH